MGQQIPEEGCPYCQIKSGTAVRYGNGYLRKNNNGMFLSDAYRGGMELWLAFCPQCGRKIDGINPHRIHSDSEIITLPYDEVINCVQDCSKDYAFEIQYLTPEESLGTKMFNTILLIPNKQAYDCLAEATDGEFSEDFIEGCFGNFPLIYDMNSDIYQCENIDVLYELLRDGYAYLKKVVIVSPKD